MSDSPQTRAETIEKLASLIRDIRVGMLTTIDTDGTPWSRPMATQETAFDGTLWFLTHADTESVEHIQQNSAAGVAYADPQDQSYVTMAGTARVLDDRDKIRELWSAPMKAWFPDGPDDPEIRLLRVDVDRAEYWDSPSSAVAYAISFVRAVSTGEPATDVGDNRKVSL